MIKKIAEAIKWFLEKIVVKSLKFSITYRVAMEASSSSRKAKIGLEMLVWGVEWKLLDFKLVPAIMETLDPNGAQSQIPPKVLLINNI